MEVERRIRGEEEELRRRGKEVSAILELSRALTTAGDLDSLLKAVIERLVEVLEPADAGALLLFDEGSGRLAVRAASGFRFEPVSQVRIKPGESILGKVFQSGHSLVCTSEEEVARAMSNLTAENRLLFEKATEGLGQPQSAVAALLSLSKRKIGVLLLECLNRNVAGFQESDLPFVETLANLIATAVDRAEWQNEAQEARALEEANRLKAELISILAHEMRTPLASIKGYSTALLLEDVQWGPEKQREFLEIIDAECDNLSEIVRDLLESSIIDAGLLEIEKEPVLLPRLAHQAVRDIARRTKIHRFLVTFSDDFPIAEADPERIRQVLDNLLDNAVKYSPDGGLIVVRGEADPSEVIISVADQGVGIAPEDLNRLFEKYFRVKSGSGRRVPGTGLGLPIAQTIVKNHGGRIWAESQLGKGTTLYFSLPLGPSSREMGKG